MPLHAEGGARVEVVFHHLTADERFEWKCGKHVQAEAQPCHVHQPVVTGEVVEDVASSFVAKRKEARHGHQEAHHTGDGSAVVRYPREAIDCGGFERAIDEQRVVVWFLSVDDRGKGIIWERYGRRMLCMVLACQLERVRRGRTE